MKFTACELGCLMQHIKDYELDIYEYIANLIANSNGMKDEALCIKEHHFYVMVGVELIGGVGGINDIIQKDYVVKNTNPIKKEDRRRIETLRLAAFDWVAWRCLMRCNTYEQLGLHMKKLSHLGSGKSGGVMKEEKEKEEEEEEEARKIAKRYCWDEPPISAYTKDLLEQLLEQLELHLQWNRKLKHLFKCIEEDVEPLKVPCGMTLQKNMLKCLELMPENVKSKITWF